MGLEAGEFKSAAAISTLEARVKELEGALDTLEDEVFQLLDRQKIIPGEKLAGAVNAARDAIHHACLLRFRPIMMTTVAALFGAVPLAFGTGDGAELRQPLGISVIGGLLVSQLLTLYTTPVVYLLLDRARHATLRAWRARGGREPLAAPLTP